MVEDEHRHGHRLALELYQHLLGLHHQPHHVDHSLVAPLYHAILLWCVRHYVVVHHTFLYTIHDKLHRSEFTSLISPQHVQVIAALHLHACLELLDRLRHFTLACQML